MKFKELDAVRLTDDFPELGLKAGEEGTVIEAFVSPEAYMVEFLYHDTDNKGLTKFDGMDFEFKPEDMELVQENSPKIKGAAVG